MELAPANLSAQKHERPAHDSAADPSSLATKIIYASSSGSNNAPDLRGMQALEVSSPLHRRPWWHRVHGGAAVSLDTPEITVAVRPEDGKQAFYCHTTCTAGEQGCIHLYNFAGRIGPRALWPCIYGHNVLKGSPCEGCLPQR